MNRFDELERKVLRIEKLIWYIAGIVSIKMGADILPFVTAIFK